MPIDTPDGKHRAALRWLFLALLSLESFEPAIAAASAKPGANDAATVSELIVTASKTVAELTVTAKMKCLAPDKMAERAERPKVVSTFPGKGAVVRPGLLVIRVTFNQPMACEGALTVAPPLRNPCPGMPQQMLLSYDRRTVRTVCVVEPGAQYGVWLSREPTARSFLGLGGLPSEPYRLNFSTSAEPAVTTVCNALVEDEETARQIRNRRTLDCTGENPISGG
jgi:hypothetical protein